MPIRILDAALAAKIAAGEVIERPASVVKELVENALDAGARTVHVELRGGGVQLLRVTDDGAGIAEDELELAFERHATSKLTSLDDLETIGTLGFRGEALPSIRAVAEVTVLSRPAAQEFAGLRMFRGEQVERGRKAGPPGTQIAVRGLFGGVPARQAFLRSASTEAAHASQVVAQYALAYPDVRFRMDVDGRTTLQTPGTGALLDAILAVHGRTVAEAMIAVDSSLSETEDRLIRVAGYVGRPSVSRGNRGGLSFFVNRRWVQSRTLAQAVEVAFQNRIMVGRHPFAVLHVSIAPGGVDVNVHPSKTEVRLRFDREAFAVVQGAVRAALDGVLAPTPAQSTPNWDDSSPWTTAPDVSDGGATQLAFAEPARKEASRVPALRVLGQIGLMYIVTEGPDGAYLVDQHAAHERVQFDRLLAAWDAGSVESQGLLDPLAVDVTPEQLEAFEQNGEHLASLGFQIERFGDSSLVVRAAPATLAANRIQPALLESLDALHANPAEWRDRLAASVACHSAVRAGMALSEPEMRQLITSLEATASPRTCPHGRPTIVHLSASQLAKEFGRI